MKVFKYALIVAVLIYIGACGSAPALDEQVVVNPAYPEKNDQAADNIRAIKVAEFGRESEDEESMIGSYPQMVVANNGNVYFIDTKPYRLKAYVPDGTFLWSRGTEGSGPGELQNVRKVAVDSQGNLFVHNQSRARLDVFSSDGDLVHSEIMNELGTGQTGFTGVLNDSTLAFSTGIRGTYSVKVFIVAMRESWLIKKEFVIDFAPGSKVDDRILILASSDVLDGNIAAPSSMSFSYLIYDESGALVKNVNRDLDVISKPFITEMDGGYSVTSYSWLVAPFRLDENWIIGQASWNENYEELQAIPYTTPFEDRPEAKSRTSFDFYDNQMHLVYSLNHEDQEKLIPGVVMGSDGRGHLYSYSGETGLVTKYKVEIEE